jgi:hypothetical protein
MMKFLAARLHVPGEALEYFFASRHIGQCSESILPYAPELIPIGARLVLRGMMNRKFFPSNLDWVLPHWAENQFNPHNPAFLPYGFDLFTINYTHRDWTMIGNAGRKMEAIVDPRGLMTPGIDGWSVDVWIETGGKLFAPSRLSDNEVEQALHENMPIVVTKFRVTDLIVTVEAFAHDDGDREWVVQDIVVENQVHAPRRATLYVAVRPFNPEGVSLVKDVEFRSAPTQTSILVNRAVGVIIPPPDAIGTSTQNQGDIGHFLCNMNGVRRVHDNSGLATGAAAYHVELPPNSRKSLSLFAPMQRMQIEEDDKEFATQAWSLESAQDLRMRTISTWRDHIGRGMRVELPDQKLQDAFEANKAFLLLFNDGDSIKPGPLTYHQFWFRDSAYMLNALDKLGYHGEARAVIERFPRHLQKDGYLSATAAEWDANGEAIWTMVEHARLSGDLQLLLKDYWSLLRMASWIHAKRQATKAKEKSVHYGLLPPGPSAEHLGPNDYFYWDDFWGLAGLREAARAAEMLGQSEDAKKLHENFESFHADVCASLTTTARRLERSAIPASPYRRLDAAMIGSLVASYPLRLFDPNDPRINDTIAALKEMTWIEDAYYNRVGHSAIGTYLSLHVAQCRLVQRDPDAWKIIHWLLNHASPTFTWAEGIHPITLHGGMGDGHHGWAAADFVLAVRNALLFEEDNHLVVTPILPKEWMTENSVIKVENAATYFGKVSFTIALGERTGTLVVRGDWRQAPEYIEWDLPSAPREAGEGAQIIGNSVRLSRGAERVVVIW